MKRALREQVAAREHTRLLFVRRRDRRGRGELRAYSATSREGEESIRGVALDSYEELRGLELATAGEPVDHPLFLACTHGKHDPCCARRGRPLFEALDEQLDASWVWQSTHVGGDRFAGNLVCLPHGVYYGRVDREDAVAVLDDHLSGRVALAHYRGRSCHPFPVQAAERDVREATGLAALDDLRLVSTRGSAESATVTFADRAGNLHERVVLEESAPPARLTCSAREERRPRRYTVRPG